MLQIIDNLQNIRDRIASAEREHNRGQGSAALVGISRKQPMGALKTVADDGLKHFGEVHIQAAIAKISRLKNYFEAAITEGATMVRIAGGIFGKAGSL